MQGGCNVARRAAASLFPTQAALHAEARRLSYARGPAISVRVFSSFCHRRRATYLKERSLQEAGRSNDAVVPHSLAWQASTPRSRQRERMNPGCNKRLIYTFHMPNTPSNSAQQVPRSSDKFANPQGTTRFRNLSSKTDLERSWSPPLRRVRTGGSSLYTPHSGAENERISVRSHDEPFRYVPVEHHRDAPIKRIGKITRSHNVHSRNKKSHLIRHHRVGWANQRWDDIIGLLERESKPMPSSYRAIVIGGDAHDVYELHSRVKAATSEQQLRATTVIGRNPSTSILKLYGAASVIESARAVIQDAKFAGGGGISKEQTWDPRTRVQIFALETSKRKKDADNASPVAWSSRVFFEHIVQLTSKSEAPDQRHEVQRIDTVASSLKDLFGSVAELHPVASEMAFNRAIGYLLRHSRMHEARGLLESMERTSVPPTVETYNLFIEDCAKRMDPEGVFRYLETLLECGSPNEDTWASLVWLATTFTKLNQLTNSLGRMGYMDLTSMSHKVVPHLIVHALDPFYDGSDQVVSFIKKWVDAADRLFGPPWLSTSAVVGFLQVLGRRGFVREGARLVDAFQEERSLTPNVKALDTLLVHCKRLRLADDAVWLMGHAEGHWKVPEHTHKTYALLFQLALKARLYNTSRVIWKFACMNGGVSSTMLQKTRASLARSFEDLPESATVQQRWEASYGRVLLHPWQPTVGLSLDDAAYSAVGLERELRASDFEVASFATMLKEALSLDKTWAATERKKHSDLEWKMCNAISIPLSAQGQQRLSSLQYARLQALRAEKERSALPLPQGAITMEPPR
ncbi:hypothetical protein FH972_026484 [Carpinus fangiana]|uniref:Pentacotripeptide-repeat region of PRORP domain-containing protein n=1 Tax=Carpinus fangiana TaxID=176857 RepID=A0A5N6L433_9ROSI|nr:hypothetical protein FH972_026484 [Carpinus fangiana]